MFFNILSCFLIKIHIESQSQWPLHLFMIHTIQNKTAKKKIVEKGVYFPRGRHQEHSLPSACLHSYHKSHAATMQETQRTKRPFAPFTRNEEGKQDAQCLSHFSRLFHTFTFVMMPISKIALNSLFAHCCVSYTRIAE